MGTTPTIGYVASPKPDITRGEWMDERGTKVVPKPGMYIDRVINDPGFRENLAKLGLYAVPVCEDLMRIVKRL